MFPLNFHALLRRYHLQPDKRLGQNFLIDEVALARIAAAADLTASDVVLEIGAGLGSLTRHLALAAAKVVAVEVDTQLLPPLEFVLRPYPNVELVCADILCLAPEALVGAGQAYKVVANIPYYITGAVIQHLLEAEKRPQLIVLTVQREVAERICAPPGDMNLLAVSVQFYGRPQIVARIPPGAFYPRPQVTSAVVRIEVGERPAVTVTDTHRFFRLVRAGFGQKRKQLLNSLSNGLGVDRLQVGDWLARAGIAPRRRAESLSLPEWAALEQAMTRTELTSST